MDVKAFHSAKTLANDDARFLLIFKLTHLQISKSSFAIGMEVEIPQQAVAQTLARGIATDSPAFFVWKTFQPFKG